MIYPLLDCYLEILVIRQMPFVVLRALSANAFAESSVKPFYMILAVQEETKSHHKLSMEFELLAILDAK